jgi:pilus assembly protein Flp/PilA
LEIRLAYDGTPSRNCYNKAKKERGTASNKKQQEGVKMFEMIQGVLQSRKGQGMVEYGLILALIAVVVIGALTLMGGNLTSMFTSTAGKVSQ